MRIYIVYGTAHLIGPTRPQNRTSLSAVSSGLPLSTLLWLQFTFAYAANEWKLLKTHSLRLTVARGTFSTTTTGQGALPLRVELDLRN